MRLAIQVRVGVVRRGRARTTTGVQEIVQPDLIAISASGGHEDRTYTWVQIYSAEPERIVEFDGRTHIEDVARDIEVQQQPDRIHATEFSWAGRQWTVDSITARSARYSTRGAQAPTFGSPNCETIYDGPSTALGLRRYLVSSTSAARVEKTMQFHSFLFDVPEGEERPLIAGRAPVASVAWSHDEVISRESPDDAPRWERRYRVHYLHPGGVVPPPMNRVLVRAFLGR